MAREEKVSDEEMAKCARSKRAKALRREMTETESEGYRVLRFWNNEVLKTQMECGRSLPKSCAGITPTQTLPHQGGGLDF